MEDKQALEKIISGRGRTSWKDNHNHDQAPALHLPTRDMLVTLFRRDKCSYKNHKHINHTIRYAHHN